MKVDDSWSPSPGDLVMLPPDPVNPFNGKSWLTWRSAPKRVRAITSAPSAWAEGAAVSPGARMPHSTLMIVTARLPGEGHYSCSYANLQVGFYHNGTFTLGWVTDTLLRYADSKHMHEHLSVFKPVYRHRRREDGGRDGR